MWSFQVQSVKILVFPSPAGYMLISKNIVNCVGIIDDSSFINKNFKEYCWDEQCILQIFLG
jgi:hypothetical protein